MKNWHAVYIPDGPYLYVEEDGCDYCSMAFRGPYHPGDFLITLERVEKIIENGEKYLPQILYNANLFKRRKCVSVCQHCEKAFKNFYSDGLIPLEMPDLEEAEWVYPEYRS